MDAQRENRITNRYTKFLNNKEDDKEKNEDFQKLKRNFKKCSLLLV